MPRRLLRPEVDSVYHCISRVVDKNYIFGEAEKRHFHFLMRRLERFCGVQVLTYCLMSNHFHLLIRVPDKAAAAKLGAAELRKLLPLIYKGRPLQDCLQELDSAIASAETGSDSRLNEILNRFDARRHSLSHFLKDLKQRFTRWHNRRQARSGTLWEHRFKSVLVENGERALLTMAAYIDLNPVRAGMVDDPKDYRWSGYGEASGGRGPARAGLCMMLKCTNYAVNRRVTWANVAPEYRLLLYAHGQQRDADAATGTRARIGLQRSALEAELKRGGKLSLAELLRCRVRYFTDGTVFGSAGYIQQVFEESSALKGNRARRKSAAHSMKGAEWGELRVLRDLQQNLFG